MCVCVPTQVFACKIFVSSPAKSGITCLTASKLGFKDSWTPKSLSPNLQHFKIPTEALRNNSCQFSAHFLLCSFG